ncbi:MULTISPECIES: helix-turn-helix transcriptional regulator [unclassified Maridesulfovibrio]|uniref:helix-turn-helix transcriptional regulator n=1 Tax=unclassified Maridesulfovibrio TaxID=2794999 RepID=UPI0029C9DCE6|nr:helix-turn-helix domain-containing protein [Maridesulfovibrio sp.]
MTTRNLKDFADLYGKGFRVYHGIIDPSVYVRLECKNPEKAFWVCYWPLLHCFGCSKRCVPKKTEGFQVMLNLPDNHAEKSIHQFDITPEELLANKAFLRVDEVMYCLRVSRSTAYRLAEEGKLIRHNDPPWRVTTTSVQAEMNNVDE